MFKINFLSESVAFGLHFLDLHQLILRRALLPYRAMAIVGRTINECTISTSWATRHFMSVWRYESEVNYLEESLEDCRLCFFFTIVLLWLCFWVLMCHLDHLTCLIYIHKYDYIQALTHEVHSQPPSRWPVLEHLFRHQTVQWFIILWDTLCLSLWWLPCRQTCRN